MLAIPDHLYQRAKEIAEATSQTIEEVLIQALERGFAEPPPPPEEEAELAALANLSDDLLWLIVKEQMPPDKRARISAMMDQRSRGEIPDADREEFKNLMDFSERLLLRKSEAAFLLTKRGHKVTAADMQPPK
jgi:hypothetical protein